jgi:hypothetical protein
LRKKEGKKEGEGRGKTRRNKNESGEIGERHVNRGSHSLSTATAPRSTQGKKKKEEGKRRDETLLFAVDDAIGVATQAELGRGRREKRNGLKKRRERAREEKKRGNMQEQKCRGNTERQSPSLKESTRERRSSSTLPTERRQANECEKRKGRVDGEWEEERRGREKESGQRVID